MKVKMGYGVMKDVEVDLPEGPIYANQLVRAFADAFVRHMLSGGLVSDEVLISSIGASHAQESCLGGVKANYADRPDFIEAVELALECWDTMVLVARYGQREGMAKWLVRAGISLDNVNLEAISE